MRPAYQSSKSRQQFDLIHTRAFNYRFNVRFFVDFFFLLYFTTVIDTSSKFRSNFLFLFFLFTSWSIRFYGFDGDFVSRWTKVFRARGTFHAPIGHNTRSRRATFLDSNRRILENYIYIYFSTFPKFSVPRIFDRSEINSTHSVEEIVQNITCEEFSSWKFFNLKKESVDSRGFQESRIISKRSRSGK